MAFRILSTARRYTSAHGPIAWSVHGRAYVHLNTTLLALAAAAAFLAAAIVAVPTGSIKKTGALNDPPWVRVK